jgi:hypothetical protein
VSEKTRECWPKDKPAQTEHLFCVFSGPSSFSHIALNGVPLPTCSDIRYLGLLVQNDVEIDRYVKSRMNAGWMKWRQVSGKNSARRMPLKLKGTIYKTIIRSVVLFGSATKVRDERRLHVTEMRMLRWMCGVTRIEELGMNILGEV